MLLGDSEIKFVVELYQVPNIGSNRNSSASSHHWPMKVSKIEASSFLNLFVNLGLFQKPLHFGKCM